MQWGKWFLKVHSRVDLLLYISGESNAYTIGYIGEHKCVSTKLPMIGHDRSAQISSGNTTTRLLGIYLCFVSMVM
jgi:hypothetical protein